MTLDLRQLRSSPHGPVRTFHPRRGRVTPRQARGLAADTWLVALDAEATLDLGQLFPDAQEVVLEIGFGMGELTWQMAVAEPSVGIIAVDVHTPGVGALLAELDERDITNVRVVHGDALILLEVLPEASLAGIRVFFPDPWPKMRHRKRRLVQQPHLDVMASRLQLGGFLHLATDDIDYASSIVATIDDCQGLDNDHDGFAPRRPTRPTTRFEQRGSRLGHPIIDIVATRTLGP